MGSSKPFFTGFCGLCRRQSARLESALDFETSSLQVSLNIQLLSVSSLYSGSSVFPFRASENSSASLIIRLSPSCFAERVLAIMGPAASSHLASYCDPQTAVPAPGKAALEHTPLLISDALQPARTALPV